MGFRDEFLWSGKTYAEWSLEKTAATGLRANEERLKELQKNVKSAFEQGVDRISESQMAAAASLKSELAYQADKIGQMIQKSSGDVVSAIAQGSADVVASIQQMSDYLGSELCEVRWAVERHTRVSEDILRILLSSLDNESRQYFEQGVKCYETNENDFARERFNKALESNRTNYFAYQYLGFVAVAEDKPDESIRNFELARKFAETSYHQALALSHLARSKYALGELNRAAEFARSATDTHPDTAKFWYESASYNARLGRTEESVQALRNAIQRDWMFWTVVIVDPDFDSVRAEVQTLLNGLREGERKKAHQGINNLQRAIDTAKKMGVGNELSQVIAAHRKLEEKYQERNVYFYRDIVPKAQKLYENTFQIAEKAVAQMLASKQKQLSDLRESVEAIKRKGYSIGSGYNKWEPSLGCLFFGVAVPAIFIIGFFFQSVGGGCIGGLVLGALALALPEIINSSNYNNQVTIPKQQMEERIKAQEITIAPQEKKIDGDIKRLQGYVESCKKRLHI